MTTDKYCGMCGVEPHAPGKRECKTCRQYREYYDSLTAAERRREEEMMARYVAESDGS